MLVCHKHWKFSLTRPEFFLYFQQFRKKLCHLKSSQSSSSGSPQFPSPYTLMQHCCDSTWTLLFQLLYLPKLCFSLYNILFWLIQETRQRQKLDMSHTHTDMEEWRTQLVICSCSTLHASVQQHLKGQQWLSTQDEWIHFFYTTSSKFIRLDWQNQCWKAWIGTLLSIVEEHGHGQPYWLYCLL